MFLKDGGAKMVNAQTLLLTFSSGKEKGGGEAAEKKSPRPQKTLRPLPDNSKVHCITKFPYIPLEFLSKFNQNYDTQFNNSSVIFSSYFGNLKRGLPVRN